MSIIKRLGVLLLDLIFPNKCMDCKTLFEYGQENIGICDKCIEAYNKPSGNTCIQCGRETKDIYCEICSKFKSGKIYKDTKFYFVKNYPIFNYNHLTKVSIFELKYGGNLSTLKGFERILKKALVDIDLSSIDLIIPIPMNKKKQRSRGFNQAELLAEIVRDITGLDYNKNVIIRNRPTTVQSNKTPKMRYENLEGCFSVIDKKCIERKTILLVDDIFTSGSTINICSKELIENGAYAIYSLTIAIAVKEDFDE